MLESETNELKMEFNIANNFLLVEGTMHIL